MPDNQGQDTSKAFNFQQTRSHKSDLVHNYYSLQMKTNNTEQHEREYLKNLLKLVSQSIVQINTRIQTQSDEIQYQPLHARFQNKYGSYGKKHQA